MGVDYIHLHYRDSYIFLFSRTNNASIVCGLKINDKNQLLSTEHRQIIKFFVLRRSGIKIVRIKYKVDIKNNRDRLPICQVNTLTNLLIEDMRTARGMAKINSSVNTIDYNVRKRKPKKKIVTIVLD